MPNKTNENLQAKQIVNFFHSTADNVGDRMSGPAQYFWPRISENAPLGQDMTIPVTKAVVGGGQIFSQLSSILARLHMLNPAVKPIGWGIGLPPKGTRDNIVEQVSEGFSALGTRNFEWRDRFAFVPCASCMSPIFDHVAPPKHDIVVYLHRKKAGPIDIPPSLPTLTNSMRPPQEAIDFIASGETVVTSSYHGVYWAQLLGRRVVCIPFNNKFKTFQHMPTLAEPDRWQDVLRKTSSTEPLLEEYRSLNRAFAQRAMGIWNA